MKMHAGTLFYHETYRIVGNVVLDLIYALKQKINHVVIAGLIRTGPSNGKVSQNLPGREAMAKYIEVVNKRR